MRKWKDVRCGKQPQKLPPTAVTGDKWENTHRQGRSAGRRHRRLPATPSDGFRCGLVRLLEKEGCR